MMLTMDVFTVICAWCNRILSAQENEDEAAKRCTHSICESCFEKMRGEIANLQTNLTQTTSVPTAKE